MTAPLDGAIDSPGSVEGTVSQCRRCRTSRCRLAPATAASSVIASTVPVTHAADNAPMTAHRAGATYMHFM